MFVFLWQQLLQILSWYFFIYATWSLLYFLFFSVWWFDPALNVIPRQCTMGYKWKKIFVPVFLLFTWEIHSSPLLEVYGAHYSWYSSPMCSLRWEDWLASKKITQLVFVAFTQSHHHHISSSLGFFCCLFYIVPNWVIFQDRSARFWHHQQDWNI